MGLVLNSCIPPPLQPSMEHAFELFRRFMRAGKRQPSRFTETTRSKTFYALSQSPRHLSGNRFPLVFGRASNLCRADLSQYPTKREKWFLSITHTHPMRWKTY